MNIKIYQVLTNEMYIFIIYIYIYINAAYIISLFRVYYDLIIKWFKRKKV